MTAGERRVLGRSLEPLPEVSLPGYLLRLAYRLDRSPGRVAELCGIHDGRQRRLTADPSLGLPDEAAAEFARVTRLALSQVHDLGLCRYATTYPALRTGRDTATTPAECRFGAYLGSVKDLYSDRWAVSFSSRYCPACGDMPENLFRRTGGVVGVREKLIQRGLRLAIEDRSERLTKDLLNHFTVTPGDMPDLDGASAEQPNIPPPEPTSKKKARGRNTVFDDDGPEAAGSAG